MIVPAKLQRVASVSILLGFAMIACGVPAAADDYQSSKELLNTTKTNIGQPLKYPTGKARIRSLIVTLQPGQSTGVHLHPALTYAYILQGEVTIDYGAVGKRTYRKGDTFMEATGHWHNGRNSGKGPCQILVVFISADGVRNVVRPTKTK